MPANESQIRRQLLNYHAKTVRSVIDAGETVANAWPGNTASESNSVTEPLDHILKMRGLKQKLVSFLRSGVAAGEMSTDANLVPAPPYIVVTSRGPICRVTLDNDTRLVISLELFGIRRNPTTYVFLDPDPSDCLSVSIP